MHMTTTTFGTVRATFPHKSTAEIAYLVERLAQIEASLAHGRSRGL